jgi:hypothetical protein
MDGHGSGRFEGYRHGGTRALVELHDRHLRSFVEAWKRAARDGVALPPTDDPDCATLPALLRHVLGSARGYMVWACGCLELPDPAIDALPGDLEEHPDAYVDHLLERWDGPLRDLDPRTAELSSFPSRWGPPYCIDAMLEHAVMHALRHEAQLARARAAGAR